MTATLYVHVGDGELRAEDAGTAVRIVAGNFEWTMLLENRLDCARWAKVIADADALFIRRKAASEAHDVIVPPVTPADIREALAAVERGETENLDAFLDADDEDDGLEALPPLPQREPGASAHPWQAAMDAELSPEALKRGAPLEQLAPEQEGEADV